MADSAFSDLLKKRFELGDKGVALKPLADLSKSHQSVDGYVYSTLVLAGSLQLIRNRELLNKINVFPIADGDTGTNMVRPRAGAGGGAPRARSPLLFLTPCACPPLRVRRSTA